MNLLKDKKYVRPDQFNTWECAKYIPEAFYSAEEVFDKMKKAGLLNKQISKTPSGYQYIQV